MVKGGLESRHRLYSPAAVSPLDFAHMMSTIAFKSTVVVFCVYVLVAYMISCMHVSRAWVWSQKLTVNLSSVTLHLMFLIVTITVYEHDVCECVFTWISEGDFWEVVLRFHLQAGHQPRVTRLAQCFYLQSHIIIQSLSICDRVSQWTWSSPIG